MTISLLRCIYDIEYGCITNLTVDELGFILTVFRDNCIDDFTVEVLEKLLKIIDDLD